MALDAIIFDLDGTLLDTNGLHARAWRLAFERFGYNIPEDRILPEIGKGGDKLVPSILGEQAARREGQALRDAHGEIYLDLIEDVEVRVFPDVRELFGAVRARGLQVAVATASKEDNLKKVTERAGLDLSELADAVVHDDDVEHSKPQPDVVQAAVRKLGLSPAQCVMVGDTPYDAMAARGAGVVCLGVLTGVHGASDMHRAGMRATYADPAGLLGRLDDALLLASPGSVHLTEDVMDRLMEVALEEARAGIEDGELPVGCVVAHGDGTIVSRAHNRAREEQCPLAHAELAALRAAATGADHHHEGRGLILATTLEPCVMCLGAAMEAGVDTILYGSEAPPNGGIARCEPIRSPGARVPRFVGGVRRGESRALLARWLQAHPEASFVADLLGASDVKQDTSG